METVGLLLNPGDSTEIVRGPRGPPIFTTSTASISSFCVDVSEIEDCRLITKRVHSWQEEFATCQIQEIKFTVQLVSTRAQTRRCSVLSQ